MKVNIEIALDCMHYNPIGEAIKYKKLFKYASKYELIDRLYRRYVRYEDIDATKELVKKIFDDISFEKSLRDKFMDAYDDCIADVNTYVKEDGMPYGRTDGRDDCPPVRIVNVTGIHTDMSPMPAYMWYISAEGDLPLKEYDNLEGNPFWMRPEYLEERLEVNLPPTYIEVSDDFIPYFLKRISKRIDDMSYTVAEIITILDKEHQLQIMKNNLEKVDDKDSMLKILQAVEEKRPTPRRLEAIQELRKLLNEAKKRKSRIKRGIDKDFL